MSVVSPAPREAWQAMLAADPNALVSQTPAWLDAACEAGPFEDASRLYELSGERQVVLPMVRRRHAGRFGTRASFPPSWGMGGVVAPGGARATDISAVLADLADLSPVRVSLRPNPLDAELFEAARPRGAVVVPRLAHVLPLDGGFERVWKEGFKSRTRTYVRKAERSGLVVERDTTGRLVPVLHELFDRSLERWARKQHEPPALARWRGHRRDPRKKFELLAARLGAACRIWVAWHEGRPAAAILVLQERNAHYTRGVMDQEVAGPTRANYLLHKLAIEDACSAGCRHYHMGESGSDAALAQFKTRFGAHAHPYAEYHFERLPITALNRGARGVVKRIIGFRD